jgi:HAMP domain-containing protein
MINALEHIVTYVVLWVLLGLAGNLVGSVALYELKQWLTRNPQRAGRLRKRVDAWAEKTGRDS